MQIKQVCELSEVEIRQIARLHKMELSDSVFSRFSLRDIVSIYRLLLGSTNNVFILAKHGVQVVGFIMASKDSRKFLQDLLKERFVYLFLNLVRIGFLRPKLFLDVVKTFFLVTKREKFPAELQFFAVRTEYQNRGIGSKMINFLNDVLSREGITHYRVGTRESNLAANRFYRKNGYKFFGKRLIFGEQFNYFLSSRLRN